MARHRCSCRADFADPPGQYVPLKALKNCRDRQSAGAGTEVDVLTQCTTRSSSPCPMKTGSVDPSAAIGTLS